MTFVPFPVSPEPASRYVRITPRHERSLRRRSALAGSSQIVACVGAGVAVIALEPNGFSAVAGGLVVFSGLMSAFTIAGARTHLAGTALDVARAAVLRRLMIALCSCTGVLAAFTVVPIAVGVDLRAAGSVAAVSVALACLAVFGTVLVAHLLKPGSSMVHG